MNLKNKIGVYLKVIALLSGKIMNNIYSVILLVFLLFIPVHSQIPDNDRTGAQEPSLLVDSIQITGNSKTKKKVILSLLDFKTGDHIDQSQLEKNIERIEQSNFFKEVHLYTQPGSQRGQVDVFIEIRERHWPYFQFKSGYNELDGWYISPIGIRFDNIIGYGNYMGLEFLIGDRISGLDFSFMRQNIMDSNLNFKLLLFTRTRQFVHYPDGRKHLQEVSIGGIGIRINSNEGLLKYLWLEFVREGYDADSTMWRAGNKDEKQDVPGSLKPFNGRKDIGKIIISLNYDGRDQRYYPISGWWGSLSLNQVSTEFGAFADYKKVILDIRCYQHLMQGWIFAMRAKAAWIDDDAPFYEKFYLGGPNSLRGYKDRRLNPLGYASRLVQGSAEIRFPITRRKYPEHFLSGVLFYDLGQAWSEPQEFDENDFHTGIGYGFRIKLPLIGLLRIDFAYPVPDYELRLHFSLGHTF